MNLKFTPALQFDVAKQANTRILLITDSVIVVNVMYQFSSLLAGAS